MSEKETNQSKNTKEIGKVGNKDLIEILEAESLLTDNICESLINSKEFIASTYTDVPMYRPLPVKLFGVLNDSNFPTAESKFWQCKVEAEIHANELIRDIHDLELAKVELEKNKLFIQKINEKRNGEIGKIPEIDLNMMELDIREQNVYMSRKRFEIKQIEKRIRYRIEEVVQWKNISDNLLKVHGNSISPSDYVTHYVNKLKHSLAQKLNDPDEENKMGIEKQIQFIDKAIESFN